MTDPLLGLTTEPDESRHFGWPKELDTDYELLGELGRGGMAVVYRAKDRELGREVAIKVVRPRFVSDEDAVARLAREARTVAQLEHPNIVGLYAVKRLPDNTLALVMQLVPGRTLKAALEQDGAFPPPRAEKVLRDIARALAYAHRCGVVHRDVKPENIFIDDASGRALLSDFGVARQLDQNTDLTATGTAIGTPTYMAPEQIDGERLDGRSDLYSLGMVGWEMLSGQRPWAGESLYTVIYRQKHDPLIPIDWMREDVPPRFQYLIEGLMQKSPDRRWSSAARFLSYLGSPAQLPGFKDWQAAQRRRRRQRVYTEARARGTGVIAAAYETVRFTRPDTPLDLPSFPAEDDQAPELPLVPGERFTPSPVEMEAIVEERPWRRRAEIGLLGLTVVAGAFAVGTVLWRAGEGQRTLDPTVSLRDRASVEVPVIAAPRPPTGADSARRDSTAIDSVVAVIPLPAPKTDSATRLVRGAVGDSARLRAPRVAPPVATVPTSDSALRADAGRSTPPPAPVVTVAFPSDRTLIAAGGHHSCMASDDGKTLCWGNNDRGQLGDGTFDGHSLPAPVAGDQGFSQVATGTWHSCAITAAGEAWCWGSNDAGQLGDGTTASRAQPARIAGGASFRTIRAGPAHTCGLSRAGAVLCWGSNAYGQIGDGSRSTKTSPSAVSLPLPAGAVATGSSHTCALTIDGAAWCWGRNDAGQLGDGSTSDHADAVPVSTDERFTSIAAGGGHTCAVSITGAAFCWGRNANGQLGLGGTEVTPKPKQVDGPVNFVVVVAGSQHSCGRTRDQRVWCWGRNTNGQLGDGSTGDRARPVSVRGGLTFTALNASASHTCGVTNGGESYCWGYNLDGQVGSGDRENAVAPARVGGPR